MTDLDPTPTTPDAVYCTCGHHIDEHTLARGECLYQDERDRWCKCKAFTPQPGAGQAETEMDDINSEFEKWYSENKIRFHQAHFDDIEMCRAGFFAAEERVDTLRAEVARLTAELAQAQEARDAAISLSDEWQNRATVAEEKVVELTKDKDDLQLRLSSLKRERDSLEHKIRGHKSWGRRL